MTEAIVSNSLQEMPGYPVVRQCPYRPPAEFASLRAEGGIVAVRLYDGSKVWVAIGYAEARAILADPRMSSSRDHASYRFPLPLPSLTKLREQRPTHRPLIGTDPPEHRQLRRQFIPSFTVQRIADLRPQIQRIVDDRLDAMAAGGSSADLVPAFALSVPSIVICELLGVPYEDHEFFEEQSRRRLDPLQGGAMAALYAYLDQLIERKQAEPGTGLLDDLLVGQVAGGALDRAELVSLALELLIAGHDTTANVLALGTLALLDNPEQLDWVREDESRWPTAAEELMRYVSIVTGLPRVATEDVEVGGQLIRAGECVILAIGAANHDPALVERPEELNLTRPVRHHLGFGYGVHQCLGQNLARAELEIGFRTLFERFPELRLAVSIDQIPAKNGLLAGVECLPVAW